MFYFDVQIVIYGLSDSGSADNKFNEKDLSLRDITGITGEDTDCQEIEL